MAGIGFELRKLLVPRSLTGTARAYLYAGVISTGPWIISILSIILLNLTLQPVLSEPERVLFSTIITHSYALALILTGGLQFVLNRHAADEISARRPGSILPNAIGALVLTAILSLIAGTVVFGLLTPESLPLKAAAISLFVYVCLIFVTANYLSVLLRYRAIVAGFLVGYLASGFAAWYATGRWGVAGGLAGFAAGHLILFAVLLGCLRRELSRPEAPAADWSFLGHLRRYPSLIWCGLLYNLGIWIDKFLFWHLSAENRVISGVLHASPEYDLAIYLSLLSIVPGLTVFFLRLETDFADRFHQFFHATNDGGRFTDILDAKDRMIDSLRSGFLHLLSTQAVVTLALLIYAGHIGSWLGIGAIQEGIFRVTLIGAFLLMLFLALMTILFYLDDRRGALLACIVFAVANGGLSLATVLANEAWYGFGFVVAAGAAMFITAWRVNARLARFEYHVFLPGAA
ncbi:MAG: exopolysaccharide Pel transporter PelG [Verrucomicrobiales bacterium]|nr:exopolysaccharide Pel transporter PelG [Verrucomicrobiales bacterium]